MRVGWLMDTPTYMGGAERTMQEFADSAPAGVELVLCPPGGVRGGCDAYVIGNCVLYTPDDFSVIGQTFTVKYWHDVGPHIQPDAREWLRENTIEVCCSPIQAEYMSLDVPCIPPPVNLEPFQQASMSVNGDRRGAVSVGSWRNYGKAPHRAVEWAQRNGGIDFYGDGPFAPFGSKPVAYDDMPALLAHYETFVFLPSVIEPFGRLVVEAWAAGCEVVTNDLVGAKWWIENDPDALETASETFWRLVTQ